MGSKYKKRADGRYMTHVNIGIRDDGKPLRKTVYAHTIRELEEKTAEIRRQVCEGSVITDESVTLETWSREWYKTYKSNLEHSTKRAYLIVIEHHIIPSLGQLKLKDVRAHHLQRMINEKAAEGLTATLRKISITLNQSFEKAVENNLIIKNPAKNIVLPKKEKPKKRALSDIEKSYIITADLDDKSRVYLLTLLYTGLRKSEALALMRNDIDLNEKTITVNKSLITINNRPHIKSSPKTEAGFRTVAMPDILVETLKPYLFVLDNIYVFPAASGNLMSDTAFRRFWGKIIKQLNIAAGGNDKFMALAKDITAHTFRHTYATMLYYAGVDIKTAQYLLGHSSISVTMEIYTHLDSEKTKTAATKINDFISSSQIVVNQKDI